MTSITSDELERKYLQFLEDNTRDVVKFAAGKQFYELNFRGMVPQYIAFKCEIQVYIMGMWISCIISYS